MKANRPRKFRADGILTENIDAYISDISRFSRITLEREHELYATMHSGHADAAEKAREELICSNLKLVVKIAHDFKRFGVTFADLVAEGNIGLCIAADKFVPDKCVQFSCYASWWIKQSMRKAIANQTRTIRIPGGSAQKLLKMQRIYNSFVQEHGKEPTEDDLIELTGFSRTTLRGLSRYDLKVYSTDELVKNDGDTTFEDMLPEATTEEADTMEEVDARIESMLDIVNALPDISKMLLTWAYDLKREHLEVSDICQELGITQSEYESRLACLLLLLKHKLVAA